MKHWLLPITAAAALSACQSARHQPTARVNQYLTRSCAPTATAIAEINDTVRSLFVALAKDDDAAVARLTAPTFYAFEGERMSAPELSAAIRKAHQAGRTYIWKIGPLDTTVDCNMAWAAWENVGAAGIAPALEPRRWLESAALVRQGDRWVLAFMHSTPVKVSK